MAPKEFSGNQGNHQNFNVSILPYQFGLIFMVMKPKKIFLEKKYKWPIQKKTEFFQMANSQIFFAKISQVGPWVIRNN